MDAKTETETASVIHQRLASAASVVVYLQAQTKDLCDSMLNVPCAEMHEPLNGQAAALLLARLSTLTAHTLRLHANLTGLADQCRAKLDA